MASTIAHDAPGSASVDAHGDDIELGFVETLEGGISRLRRRNWMEWDGGKLGGKPIWLDPAKLPSAEKLRCKHCADPMRLLCQLYSPLDEDQVGHGDAFHRMLYVFACAKVECLNRAGPARRDVPDSASVLVFRCQLPQSNEFHPLSEDEAASCGDVLRLPAAEECAVCGLPASSRCSKCKIARYCCRQHQLLHWSAGHKAECTVKADSCMTTEAAHVTGILFKEWDVVTEAEPTTAERTALENADAAKLEVVVDAEADEPKGEDGEGELSIADLTQKKLAEITGARLFDDPVLAYFQRRTACEPKQVIRYCRWPTDDQSFPALFPSHPTAEKDDDEDHEVHEEPFGAPLWMSRDHCAESATSIRPCERCGAARKFEFQLMPQSLFFLQGDVPTETDFGVLVMYTCSASCALSADDRYAEELAWVQAVEQEVEPIASLLAKAIPEDGETCAE